MLMHIYHSREVLSVVIVSTDSVYLAKNVYEN